MSDLEKLRDETARRICKTMLRDMISRGAAEQYCKETWDALLKILTEAAGEFDEQAAHDKRYSGACFNGDLFVAGARWQFEADRARIGKLELEIDHLKTSIQIGKDFAEINANRMKAAEARARTAEKAFEQSEIIGLEFKARLAESERDRLSEIEKRQQMFGRLKRDQEKLQASEARVANLQMVCRRLSAAKSLGTRDEIAAQCSTLFEGSILR